MVEKRINKQMENKDRMNKKAQGHIEMILSLVIFMSFVGVLFFFLNPVKDKQITSTILDMTEASLLNELSFNYGVTSITLKGDYLTVLNGKPCFSVDNTLQLSGNLIVIDESNRFLQGRISSLVEVPYSSPEKFYRLYSSDKFLGESTASCQYIAEEYYTFGAIRQHNAILYENLEEIANQYKSDYEGLRQRLNLKNDFMFFVYNPEDTNPNTNILFNATIYVPNSVEISARNLPLIAINKMGEKKSIILNIRAW